MLFNFRSRFWRIAFAVVVFGGSFLVHYMRPHRQYAPPEPAMTTQQAYDQICGEPDDCASMAKVIHDMQALSAQLKQQDPSPPGN